MNVLLKELPDSTVMVITPQGRIIATFDNLDEVEELFFQGEDIRQLQLHDDAYLS